MASSMNGPHNLITNNNQLTDFPGCVITDIDLYGAADYKLLSYDIRITSS